MANILELRCIITAVIVYVFVVVVVVVVVVVGVVVVAVSSRGCFRKGGARETT